jgi:hypothetical protein
VERYEPVTLDPAVALNQVRESGQLSLVAERERFDLVLTPHDLRAPEYRAQEMTEGGVARPLEPGPVRTYKGTVRGVEGAEARFTIDERTVEGVILTGEQTYFVEPLGTYSKASGPTDFVLYRASDVKPGAAGTCATTLADRVEKATSEVAPETAEAAQRTERLIRIATEADSEFVTRLGGAFNAREEILSVLNQVEGVYSAELGLTFLVVFQNVWTTQADPYIATDPSVMRLEFEGAWSALFAGVARDVAHMWTGKTMDGNAAGIARVGSMCRSYYPAGAFGITEMNPAIARFIIPAHEIGHNLGATHPNQWWPGLCANTIMESNIGSSPQLTFCQESRREIATHLAFSVGCMASVPEGCFEVVPQDSWRGDYFNNIGLSGTPAMVRNDGEGNLDFDFGLGGPGCDIGADNFSVRWTRSINFPAAATYRFTVGGDDGVRLFVDGALVLDQFVDQSLSTFTVDVPLIAGRHDVVLEYFEHEWFAAAKLSYQAVDCVNPVFLLPGYWIAEYYRGRNLTGAPAVIEYAGTAGIDIDWGGGGVHLGTPCAVGPDNFSARFATVKSFRRGLYRFTVTADDGVRLYVDGELVIDAWVDQGPTTYTADVDLLGGDHAITLEYYEHIGSAMVQLSWQRPRF